MKRTPLRRTTPLKRASKKRVRDEAERRQIVAFVRERDRYCQAAKVRECKCWGPLDVHEIRPRGRGGDWLDPENCVLVCRAHHDWIHGHPVAAEEHGLLR